MEKRIIFTGKNEISIVEFAATDPAPHELQLRTLVSVVSAGSETIVLNRDFALGTNWDAWVKYPFAPGYTAALEVVKVGSEVVGFDVGDLVVSRKGHASLHNVGASECYKIPAGIDVEAAAWFGLAKIAAMGARAAELKLGRSVAVVGAGPIGQMAVRWCAAAGAYPIVAIDPIAARGELALRGGASHALAAPLGESEAQLRELCGGEGPEVVIDSTGNHKVFGDLMRVARRFGRVVLLGDTGWPDKQHLTHDLLIKGLQVVGAHDPHDRSDWNTAIITNLFFHLVKEGRFNLEGLTTHRFSFSQYEEAYRMANDRSGGVMGISFDWRGLGADG